MRKLTNDQARRLALTAQGFKDGRPAGVVNRGHLRRAISRMGLLQLDSVNVVARSHYLPVFARLGPYRQELLDSYAYGEGQMFEYWGHEASLIPIERLPYFRYRMSGSWRWGQLEKLKTEEPEYIESVFVEVERHGPLTVGDLSNRGERTGPWWGYGKGKLALEHLFLAGRIAVADRPNFTKSYDVSERVWNQQFASLPHLPIEEAHRELVSLGVGHLGVGTVADIADYYRLPLKATRVAIDGLLAAGRLQEVEVDGWGASGFMHPDVAIPRVVEADALLSPFDPIVWYRARAERLFNFHYRIEIYTPQPKRIYGYYVMPFLHRGELTARVDLKADRQERLLRVRGSYLEPGHSAIDVGRSLATELSTFGEWLGLEGVTVEDRGDLAPALLTAIG